MVEFIARPGVNKYGLSAGASTGKFLFLGSMALDIERLERLPEADTLANEVRICLNSIETRLNARGLQKRDIVKVTAYATEVSYMDALYRGLEDFFSRGPFPPICPIVATVAADCRFEFEIIAAE
jgi:2-iminobutanoate/2-iminopropanoate deaminase